MEQEILCSVSLLYGLSPESTLAVVGLGGALAAVIRRPHYLSLLPFVLRWVADKSLAQPGRKQATATKLGIYST
jgi:hypothetical protein